jgi:D-alanine-D-alanine ligase
MDQKSSEEKIVPPIKGSKTKRKILGPVENLEDYVRSDWWRSIFNSLYLKTDADVVNDENITRFEVDLFTEVLGLNNDNKILDLCCGHGRHSLELARRGFKHVEGLERSHYLVQRARISAKKDDLSVKFREGDARKLPYPDSSFDVVLILGNSFGYFETINDDLRVLKQVFRVLRPWGRLLIDAADGEFLKNNFQPRSWEWIDKKHFVCRERSLSLDNQRLISREVITNVNKGVIADQFYGERLYTQDILQQITKTAGFTEIKFHGTLTPDSKRNQDLGMMERRILASVMVRKDWTPAKILKKEGLKNVAVIMGDPHKPDTTKPDRIFDDDDFYTIDQLKKALCELPGYSFIYLNNHDTLVHDLVKLKGKLEYVYNLCDEGYNNDPRKELHVPALLEKLGIQYTGAGPQCLAYCYDKSLVRGIAKEMGIPVPEAFFIKPEDSTFELPFSFPVIVKPNFGDSSFGITQRSVAYNIEALVNAILEIRDKFGYEKPILVEEFLTGKDLSIGIIGNPPDTYTILPVTEEDYSTIPEDLPRICGYEAKWMPHSPYWNIKSVPTELDEKTRRCIEEWCLKLFERLECRDYCRVDMRLNTEGMPKLLEVNPNPGWCWDGHLAKMAKFANMTYTEMQGSILKTAEQRFGFNITSQNGDSVISNNHKK